MKKKSIPFSFQVTRGWILNEIFCRADPQGRTIGEFLRTEISGPLNAGVQMGLPSDEDLNRVSDLKNWSMTYVLGQSMLPYSLGSKVDLNLFELLGLGYTMWKKGKTAAEELKRKGITKPIQVEDVDLGKGWKIFCYRTM